jgi:plastocyanin
MNFTVGIIAAVGVLVAISLAFIMMDPGYIVEPQAKPVACTMQYDPVCGVDDITYGNSCMLNAANIKLAYTGECVQKPLQDGFTRMTSTQHPGMGHESHQSVSIISLSEKVSSGTLHYDASEPIQLIALHGPLKDGEAKGQPTWTLDGVTKYALTFVTPDSATGEWKFAGNALAIHTKNTEPFTVDYKVDLDLMSDTMTGTIDSVQDPGMGHESHQIAIIIAPSSDVYSGILSYSASEPIQLITLRGPIGPDEHPEKTWTVDGTNIFEMTFVDPANAMGSWEFAGNALAVHTKNTAQFTVSYSVSAAKTSDLPPASGISLAPSTFNVSIPQGVSAPGCESTDECYLPYSLTIQVGDTVLWSNDDTAAHTVTSGTPDGIDGVFDSGLFMSGNTFDYTFDKSGTYPYFCMVHPWMIGEVIVNETFDVQHGITVGEPSPSAPIDEPVAEPAPESTDEPTPIEEPAAEPTEKRAAPVEVTMAKGSSAPGCETTNECYLPYAVEIYSGEPVVWINTDSAAHTVTSGLPALHDGLFDSGMIIPNQKWDHVFTDSGEYDYHCMLHPWMTGKVIVS